MGSSLVFQSKGMATVASILFTTSADGIAFSVEKDGKRARFKLAYKEDGGT